MNNRKLLTHGVVLLLLSCTGDSNTNHNDSSSTGAVDAKPDGAPSHGDGAVCPAARDCSGRSCGLDPVCGASCGRCSSGSCNALGACRAAATCDPACVAGESCKNGFCVKPDACSPGAVECASDGFGFRGCGNSPKTGQLELGPRAPCAPNDPCAAGRCAHTARCVPGKLVFVVDRSSSMAGAHFAWVEQAVTRFQGRYGNHNYTGFRFMPGGQSCGSGSIDVPLRRDYVAQGQGSVAALFDRNAPTVSADSPIGASLTNLAKSFGDPADGQAVVLLTDGEDTCDELQRATTAAQRLMWSGIYVYVLRLSTTANPTPLDAIARAGGTVQSYLVNSAAEITRVLDTIRSQRGLCACAAGSASCMDSTTLQTCSVTGRSVVSAKRCDKGVCQRGRCLCTGDEQCSAGEICEGQRCTPGCREREDCPAGQLCEGKRCIAGCIKDDECAPGEICEGKRCRPGCRSHGGCPLGQVCSWAMECIDGCGLPKSYSSAGITGRCPLGLACVPVNCFNGKCEKFVCTRNCVGRSCKSDPTATYSCWDKKTCVRECTSDRDCPADERCQWFTIDSPASSRARRICAKPCTSDAQCKSKSMFCCDFNDYWSCSCKDGRCQKGGLRCYRLEP